MGTQCTVGTCTHEVGWVVGVVVMVLSFAMERSDPIGPPTDSLGLTYVYLFAAAAASAVVALATLALVPSFTGAPTRQRMLVCDTCTGATGATRGRAWVVRDCVVDQCPFVTPGWSTAGPLQPRVASRTVQVLHYNLAEAVQPNASRHP